MTRETRDINIAGKNFKLNTYLTGREERGNQEILLKAGEFNMEGKLDGGIDTSVLAKSADYLIKTVIVSIDEITDKEQILNTVLDMRADEYQLVLNEVKRIGDVEKEKKS